MSTAIHNEMIVDHRIIVELNAIILIDPCRGSNNFTRDFKTEMKGRHGNSRGGPGIAAVMFT